MAEIITPIHRNESIDGLMSPGDLQFLSLLQDLNHKQEIDYERDIRPLFATFPPTLMELNNHHFDQFESALRASNSFPPLIAEELSKLRETLLPTETRTTSDLHAALEACHLGSIYDNHHKKKVEDHYQATQNNHANILALSRCVAALEKAKLSQEGDHLDLTEIRPMLEEGSRIYAKLTEGTALLDCLDLPEDMTKVSKDQADDLLRKLGEGKILEQGKGPQILTLMRKEVELMLIVFQALQKILEMDSKFKQRVSEKMSRGT